MFFDFPQYLWALSAIPLLVGFFLYLSTSRERLLNSFAHKKMIPRLTKRERFSLRPLRAGIFIAAYTLFIIALARPRFGLVDEVFETKAVDIIVALDISRSMLAEDIRPNRMDRAKFEVGRFISTLQGERVGVVIFAGMSHLLLPLTTDYSLAESFVNSVTTDYISLQGTDIVSAIAMARRSFVHPQSRKVLLLISDGEDHEEIAEIEARKAAEEGITIYSIGVGSYSGVPIPIRSGDDMSYLRDANGDIVMTRTNPKMLEKLSLSTGGAYFTAGPSLDISSIYKEIESLESEARVEEKRQSYAERYQIFLVAALILLSLFYLLPEAVSGSDEWRGRFV